MLIPRTRGSDAINSGNVVTSKAPIILGTRAQKFYSNLYSVPRRGCHRASLDYLSPSSSGVGRNYCSTRRRGTSWTYLAMNGP